MSTKRKAEEAQAIEAGAAQTAAETQKTAAAPQPVVYLGPTLEHVVAHGTVFTHGLPEALTAKIEEKPFINGLIFPVSGTSKAVYPYVCVQIISRFSSTSQSI